MTFYLVFLLVQKYEIDIDKFECFVSEKATQQQGIFIKIYKKIKIIMDRHNLIFAKI